MMRVDAIKNVVNDNVKLEKLKKACADFESLFYHEILKTSKNTFKSNLLPQSVADDIYKDMFYVEVSKVAAEKSEGGIKDILFDFLSRGILQDKGKNYQNNGKNVSVSGQFISDLLA
ncbi:hypothetical protein FHQ18_02120 [Deferribacter autotrophicus]|uniref:Flagellar protein FlgJ N-terminal domain-containing protein n=1 Tax=Deferribacter autotrophicus TaxID=500465 RepID=A0A5A8F3I7_9BACT|nr:rod-binding protein [Deferribacter autotrophicus]KAA0258764.1 hypothetical protein FHQ18_02120 [Deferribacter autotrophicus]